MCIQVQCYRWLRFLQPLLVGLLHNLENSANIGLDFERDPVTTPTDDEPNPASLTNIKCVFWGGPITSSNAVNWGYVITFKGLPHA